MTYPEDEWRRRMASRIDMSSQLVHLTRETREFDGTALILKPSLSPFEMLVGILKEGKVRGSTTCDIGNDPQAFANARLYSDWQTARHVVETLAHRYPRYPCFGLAFRKTYVFDKGGRPVGYGRRNNAKDRVGDEGHAHEGRWRVYGDFKFDLSEATVLVSTETDYRELLAAAPTEMAAVSAVVPLGTIGY